MGIKIEVGKFYWTRSGHAARVTMYNEVMHSEYPHQGFIAAPDDLRLAHVTWTFDGRFSNFRSLQDSRDLVVEMTPEEVAMFRAEAAMLGRNVDKGILHGN